MSDSRKVTLVVGLGEVGAPLCAILKRFDARTIGIDVEPTDVDAPIGIMHVCIPFAGEAQFQNAVIGYARKFAPELIVVNSTVVPGTTRSLERACGIPCVYSPVRGKHARMAEELLHYDKFIAGTDLAAVERAMDHFQSAGFSAVSMSTPESLELAKLLETTYFGLLIAWAQEMNRFAVATGADYLEIGRFFREISYLPGVLFQPGYIGGHCVMPNINLLEGIFQSDFLEAIKSSNHSREIELEAGELKKRTDRLQPIELT